MMINLQHIYRTAIVFALLLMQTVSVNAENIVINTSKDSLFVFDNFDLEGPGIVGDSSGFGWAGTWRPSGNTDNSFSVNTNSSLSYPSSAKLGASGGYVYNPTVKGIGHGRYLSNGIVLGSDAAGFASTFYVSFLAQKSEEGYFRIDGGDGTNVRFSLGVNADGTLTANIANVIETSTEAFFENDKVYLIVARWNYADNQSNLKMTLLDKDETVPDSDSGLTWDLNSPGGITGLVMNYLRFAISSGTVMMDEFRIGSTWASVTGNLNAPENLLLDPESGDAATGNTSTTLSWNDLENEDGYKIFVDNQEIADLGTDITHYKLTGLDKSPSYHIAVSAYNSIGLSARSNAVNFVVANPLPTDFYVKDYGALGDGLSDDFNAIQTAIEAFANFPYAANLHFESGKTYKCEGAGVLFSLSGVSDKTILGNGANIIVEPAHWGLRINNCDNIVVKDITFDYNNLSWTQGRIKAIDAINGTFNLDVEEGYPIPTNNFALAIPDHPQSWGMFWGSEGYEIKNELVYIDKCEVLDGNSVKFTVRDDIKSALDNIVVGDQFSVDVLGLSGPFHLIEKSENISCQNITMYTTKGQGFITKLNRGRIHFDNIQYRRKPGTTRLMTIYRGGIINRDNAIGPIIENCYIEGLGDDAIALSAYTYYVNASASTTEFTLNDATTFEVGDTLLFVDMKVGSELGKTVIVSKSGDNITTKDAISGVSPGEERVSTTTNVMNLSRSDNGFIIRNNTFAGQRRYAILCRAQYGLIEGNVCEKTGSGIVMTNETGPAYSGPVPRDITIRNNSFSNIRRWPIIAQYKAYTGTPDQLLRNLRIIDNSFGPATQFTSAGNTSWAVEPVITLTNVDNVELTGNTLVNDVDAGAMAFSNCRNISIKCGNTFNQTPIISLAEGISIGQNMTEEELVFELCEDPSLTSNNKNSIISLYPVPVEDKFQIVCDDLISWSVINMQGQELLSGREKEVNASSLPAGFYLIKIMSLRNEVYMKSFVKN